MNRYFERILIRSVLDFRLRFLIPKFDLFVKISDKNFLKWKKILCHAALIIKFLYK